MIKSSAIAIALLLITLPEVGAAARLALVIGIDRYSNVTSLRNAGTDAQTVARTLREIGYREVRVVAPSRNLRELKDDIRSFAATIRSGDEVLFYFSGHGVQIGADNYLLPSDVRSQNEAQVRDDALALTEVLQLLRQQSPAFTLAVIDACRDNPFQGRGRSIGAKGLTGVSGATGQMVIYAAGEGQQALDRLGDSDPVPNGVFTRVFVRQIRRPGVSVRDILQDVREEVYSLARSVNHAQVPAIYDQVLGRFYFVEGGSSPPPAAMPASPARKASDPTTDGPFVFYIQPGAYQRAEEAEQQRKQLALMGYESKVTERELAGRLIYRVRLGPYADRDSADKIRVELQSKSVDAVIVRVGP